YLLQHANNPVDWYAWGDEAFERARREDKPIFLSIGYSTCHWCHVMARESFSDPVIAARLNSDFVSVKVDREEHPDVDASYLTAAGAFTDNLGWPLNVFVTPTGRAFFAGTYFPPQPLAGHPSFSQVLDAVQEAWTQRRDQVEDSAAKVAAALGSATTETRPGPLPTTFDGVVAELVGYEDTEFGGFGGAPKFPVAPVLLFLLERGAHGDDEALGLVERTLVTMAGSPLRDAVEGGFFRYSTRRDWGDPHYERMLYDNALLLRAYTRLEALRPAAAPGVAAGIADFLIEVLQQPGGGFASAQDSESTIVGETGDVQRIEGGYYALDAAARVGQTPPDLDGKILTGWNGLAIEGLAAAGFALDRPEWSAAAVRAADYLLERHRRLDGSLIRASIGDRESAASATLEDYGMFASGLLQLATATGEARFAVAARELIDLCLSGDTFTVPGGADPALAARGLALASDPSEGAYPSGISAIATAAEKLSLLTGDRRYREAATEAMRGVAPLAMLRPISFGSSLDLIARLAEPVTQLVVVGSVGAEVARAASVGGRTLGDRSLGVRPVGVSTIVSVEQTAALAAAGFELFAGREREAAYLCRDFVCRLPITDAETLAAAL
ncbi:MAG: thioredoxin domain-containing protein, partial [Lacisediminihabitans sp.]